MKQEVDAMLQAMLGGDKPLIDSWWNRPNKAFEEKHPVDVPIWEVHKYLLQFM